MASTTTTPVLNTKDQVEIKITGEVSVDVYGDIYVTDEQGTKVYLNSDLQKRATVTRKHIAEPSKTGSIVMDQFGDKYMKTGTDTWKHISKYGFGSTYKWSEVLGFGGLQRVVGQPMNIPPVENILDWARPFTNTDGTTTSVYLQYSDRSLVIGDRSKKFTKDEAIRLARAILKSNGLEA